MVVPSLNRQTSDDVVVVSNPAWPSIERLSLRETTRNHLIKIRFPCKKVPSPVSDSCQAQDTLAFVDLFESKGVEGAPVPLPNILLVFFLKF